MNRPLFLTGLIILITGILSLISGCEMEMDSPFLEAIQERIAEDVEEAAGGSQTNEDPPTPYLTITHPNGGESFKPGQDLTISWLSNAQDVPVRIDIFKGEDIAANISESTMNSGTFSWKIPEEQAEGDDYKISISGVGEDSFHDISDESFSIGNMLVSYPNGGETFATGGECTITWVSNYPGTIAIDVGSNDTWTTIATGEENDGSYHWSPITVTGSMNYRIRVRSESVAFSDESNGDFAVVDDTLSVLSPAAAAFTGAGDEMTVSWTGILSGNVKVELFKGAALSATLAANTPNDGLLTWTVPPAQPAGDDYKIKISTLTSPSFFSMSEAFTMESLSLTSPTAGTITEQGVSRNITWTSSGKGYVKIELFKGTNPNPIAVINSSTENDGSLSWTPTQSAAGDYHLKISSLNVTTQTSEGSYFTIEKIAVTAPTAGQLFASGVNTTIYWTSSGTGSVDIQLYRNTTPVGSVITTPNDGDYTWTFAAGLSAGTNYNFRVRRSEALGIGAYSAQFTVERITLTAPNGNTVFTPGGACPITWTGSGLGTVKIELLKNGLLDQTVTSNTTNNGTYNWTIPGTKTSGWNYKVRITHNNVSAYDDSDTNFIVSHWTYLGKPTTSKSDSPEIVVDSSNTPILLYRDYAYPGTTQARPVVKKWSSGTTWTDMGVAFLGVPEYLQLALRTDGSPVVAGRNTNVNYPVCYRWTGGTSWTYDGLPMGNSADAHYLALAVGSDNKPILALTESSTYRTKVISGFAYPWASWGYLSAAGNMGAFHSMAMGSDNKPFVIFIEYSPADPPTYWYVRTKKYASETTWTDYGILANHGFYPSAAINPSDGKPVVIYADFPTGTTPGNLIVKKWSTGTTWVNYGTLYTGSVSYTDIIVAGDGLVMAAYRDDTYEIKVKVWQGGTSWADLGYISNNNSVEPKLAVGSDNLPVLTFTDNLINDQDNVVVYKWK